MKSSSIELSAPVSRPSSFIGKGNAYVFVAGMTASLSGLVFGFNIGVSGGVTERDNFLQTFFPELLRKSRYKNCSSYCKYDDHGLQAFTSSLYMAGLISTLLASYVTKQWGRRPTMLVAGLLSLVGVALTAGSQHFAMLIFGRILLGVAAGFANQAAPIYISEIAPAEWRGLLSSMFQMNITIGIFIANMVNFASSYLAANLGWRVALALGGVPSSMLVVGSLSLVESPISLIERGKHAKGKANLQKVRGTQDVDEEFENMVRTCTTLKATPDKPFRSILKLNTRPQLIISILTPVFQQFTGINAIMLYSPVLFQTVGFQSNASLFSAAIVGGINIIFTVASMLTVDRLGRKFLLIGGGLQMIVAQVSIALILWTMLNGGSSDNVAPLPQVAATAVVVLVCVFVAGFGWSWGPITWLICSELFPIGTRSAGQSVTVFMSLVATCTIAQTYLSMLCAMKHFIFIFFAAWLIMMTFYVILLVPETKSIPLDSMEQVWKQHWFWKTVVPNVARNGLPISSQVCGSVKMQAKRVGSTHNAG